MAGDLALEGENTDSELRDSNPGNSNSHCKGHSKEPNEQVQSSLD